MFLCKHKATLTQSWLARVPPSMRGARTEGSNLNPWHERVSWIQSPQQALRVYSSCQQHYYAFPYETDTPSVGVAESLTRSDTQNEFCVQ